MRALLSTVLVAAAFALALSPPALADTSDSSNWAGYAIHRSGVSFMKVSATWKEPHATCPVGSRSFSAMWVGLGGYRTTANALEQIGTELDCRFSGTVSPSAWYELVPGPSQPIQLRVEPGDTVNASVTVSGHRVMLSLTNATSHRSFHKTLRASDIDVSSAEWILEAPSNCITPSSCQTLPLADFGTATFTQARAESTKRHTGTISDRGWGWTKIRLSPGGRRFIAYRGYGIAAGAATPSALRSKGSSFILSYSVVTLQGNPFFAARREAVRAGHLVHSGRRR